MVNTPRRKPRSPKLEVAGSFPVDSGTAEIIADPERDGAYTLELNRVPSSYFVLGAPRVLGFDYMEWIAAILRSTYPEHARPTFLHLGGAGCSLPRYCADAWARSRQVAVDVDKQLLELARQRCDLPPDIELIVADAREALQPADAVIRDVFAGPTVPNHLTTKEFFAKVATVAQGLYIANIGDREHLPSTRTELAGMLEAFPNVGAVSTRDMLGGRAYGNVVVYGSFKPVVVNDLPAGAEHRGTQWARDLTGTV